MHRWRPHDAPRRGSADTAAGSASAGAKTRRGEPCANWTVQGRSRCRMHGGARRGSASAPRRSCTAATAATSWADCCGNSGSAVTRTNARRRRARMRPDAARARRRPTPETARPPTGPARRDSRRGRRGRGGSTAAGDEAAGAPSSAAVLRHRDIQLPERGRDLRRCRAGLRHPDQEAGEATRVLRRRPAPSTPRPIRRWAMSRWLRTVSPAMPSRAPISALDRPAAARRRQAYCRGDRRRRSHPTSTGSPRRRWLPTWLVIAAERYQTGCPARRARGAVADTPCAPEHPMQSGTPHAIGRTPLRDGRPKPAVNLRQTCGNGQWPPRATARVRLAVASSSPQFPVKALYCCPSRPMWTWQQRNRSSKCGTSRPIAAE